MKGSENNKWLDDLLTEAIGSEKQQPNFEKFKQTHKKEIETLTSRAGRRQSAKRPLYIRNIIMKHKLAKIAVAAVIVITVLAFLPFFSGGGQGVVLADVLERIEQARGVMYKMQMTITGAAMQGMPAGKQEMNSTITISDDYGMKMQMTTTDANTGQREMVQQMYILPDKKEIFMVMPEQKKYIQMELDDDMLARMKKQNNDPREMMKQIMNCEYTELGESVIDGVEVEGFQTTDPSFAGSMGGFADVNVIIWVDIEEQLPVRMEMYFKMNEQMEMSGTVYDYQWDVQVEKSEFEPVIPEDFTTIDGVKMPSMSEEAAIEGLKFFADITGNYPEKLNLMGIMQEFQVVMTKGEENLTEAAVKLKEKMEQMGREDAKKVMEMMRPVQSLGMFYMMLVQDKKEPAYYGDNVTAEDVDKVLLRWKVSDDEYRVIYGDLTGENVSSERLAELESRLEQ